MIYVLSLRTGNFRQALSPLKELYGYTLAKDFGLLILKTIRQKMMEKGWCRIHINKMVNRIKLIFKWLAEN